MAVDGGEGCVEPTEETIADGSYQPLSRPIFIYVNAAGAERPEFAAFVEFYLEEGPEIIPESGYIPFPPDFYDRLIDRFVSGRTGSIFLETDVESGIRLEDLLFPEEK